MKLKQCVLCQRLTQKILRRKWCRGCYETAYNQECIDAITEHFLSPAPFNDRLFKKCLGDLGQIAVKRQDVRMLARIAGVLGQEPLAPPSTWREARAISARLAIRYSFQPKMICPIFRIARELEESGEIPHDSPEGPRYEKVLFTFPPEDRQRIETYIRDAVAGGMASPGNSLKVVLQLRYFLRFLKGGDLFNPDMDLARSYFKSGVPRSVRCTHNSARRLQRFYHWSVKQGYSQVNPFQDWRPDGMIRTCDRCGKTRLFTSHDRLCDSCYADSLCRAHLEMRVKSYRAPSPYNQYLFDLYVMYVNRFHFSALRLRTTETLIKFLESKPLPALRSWKAVSDLSRDFAREQTLARGQGCPIFKIGSMLQELGVLPIKQTDRDVQIEGLLSRCDPTAERILRRYLGQLVKMKCAAGGKYGSIHTVFEFYRWLANRESALGLWNVTEKTALEYLHGQRDRDRSGIRRKALNRFYRWAKAERLTLMNPMEAIPVPKVARSILVCDDRQIRKIEAFVKNPGSDPGYALMLALVLYWGLSLLELTLSTLDLNDRQIWIHVHRRQLGPGRKAHNRDPILKLPLEPEWLAALQKRYIRMWQEQFAQAKKNFPLQPLILSRSSAGRTNRYLHSGRVRALFYQATIAATGSKIQPSLLRRTSGHIHVDHGDASRLTKLGWSESTGHSFSILPRTYFTPPPQTR